MTGDMIQKKRGISLVNTSVLAYVGDAAYRDSCAQTWYFSRGLLRPDRLHKASVAYVRAEAQAAVFDVIWDELSPDERAVARRGKNHKITSMPHNVNQLTYKKATAFKRFWAT